MSSESLTHNGTLMPPVNTPAPNARLTNVTVPPRPGYDLENSEYDRAVSSATRPATKTRPARHLWRSALPDRGT